MLFRSSRWPIQRLTSFFFAGSHLPRPSELRFGPAIRARALTPSAPSQSTFIGRAATKNKGRISRFLANKCSIASRIDCFSDAPTTKFGEVLRGQVEERLSFYENGSNPTKVRPPCSQPLSPPLTWPPFPPE